MKRSRPLPVIEVDVPSCESAKGTGSGFEYDVASQSSLVGDVLDKTPAGSPGRVLVRWRTVDGTLNERLLCVVRGLAIENGDLVLLHRPSNWPEWLVVHVVDGRREAQPVDAGTSIRGRRIEIEGADEVVLRCGEASITLRRNGRVVLEAPTSNRDPRGTNRIKGGTVQIN